MRKLLFILFVILLNIMLFAYRTYSQQVNEINRFTITEVRQAVAVDNKYFYVINNSTITKHYKNNGIQIAEWDGVTNGISHLNSGVVIKGRLYCASSNYPDSPMAGSIEIFDARTLKHVGNHSFGIFTGSPTWIDQHKGNWYVGFAHYTGQGSSEGKDTRWTTVMKLNKKWQQVESWMFPKNIIDLFKPKSNSGATWGNDGKLYSTGHDKPEIYVMEIPQVGHMLKHVKTIQTPVSGQGIAFDRTVKSKMVIYGINRGDNEVIVFEIK